MSFIKPAASAAMRRSPMWPTIRRLARPLLAAALSVGARVASWRRHQVRRMGSVPSASRAAVVRRLDRHPARKALVACTVRSSIGTVRAGRHALRTWRARRDPVAAARPYFDPEWYITQHPEVRATGTDPWTHYRSHGVALGHAPNPLFDVPGYRYDHPELDSDDDPLVHYALVGRYRNASPHPLIVPAWYRRTHPDVGRVEPYLHYLRVGHAERRAASAAILPGTDILEARIAFTVPALEQVAIIIPAYRSYAHTVRCLHALATWTPAALGARVILADDDPDHPLGPVLGPIPGLTVHVNDRNLGFLRNCNRAAASAQGDHLVFLNSDAIVSEGWLDALLAAAAAEPRAALVGSRLVGTDGRLQEAGVIMYRDADGTPYGRGDDPERPQYLHVRDVDCVSGACLLVRRDTFQAVGGFDDAFAPAFFEEYDLAFALWAHGERVRYQPQSRVIHAGAASYGTAERDRQTARNRDRFRTKWARELARQPADRAKAFLARDRGARPVLLVVDDRVPEHDRHAGALWMRQYMGLLAAEGIRVVFAPDDGVDRRPYTDQLRQAGIEVLAPDVDLDAWLDEHGRFIDWVLLARPLPASRRLPSVRRWTGARIVYFTHDLHWLREERRGEATGDSRATADSRYLREIETAVCRSVDVVLTPSTDELPYLEQMAPAATIRLLTPFPDLASSRLPEDAPALGDRTQVMFLGGFEHLPNVDAALLLVGEIMPQVWAQVPEARVLIVGASPPPEVQALADERVAVTGYVPDLRPCLTLARMTVSPLRFGSGVKGKILTSLAAGVPVITTSVGNEGLGLTSGVDALIGDTPAELAAHIVALYRDAGRADALAMAGLRFLDKRFSPDRARRALLDALGPPRPRDA